MNPNNDLRQRLKARPYAYNLVLIALTIVALLAIAHLAMQFGTRHGSYRRVPDFSGIGIDDARLLARKNKLQIVINDSLFVPAYDGGIVLDQLPRAGAEVKDGRTVYVTINSFSQKRVEVPYVAGRSLRQAKNMLEIAGLEIRELVYRPDMATNYVLEQRCQGKAVTPDSHIDAEIGSGVTLYVGVAPDEEHTIVPKVVGFPLAEAKSRLWEQGINVGRIEFDEGIDLLNQKEARVYSQQPQQGHTAELGSTVSLRLTLDREKTARQSIESDREAREIARERLRREAEAADSMARAEVEQNVLRLQQHPTTEPDENFF